jgi:hypothetical protein
MTLNRRSKGTVLIGSIGAVALVLGLVIAGIYPNNSSSTPPGQILSDSELGQNETNTDPQDIVVSEEEENESNNDDPDPPVNNTNTDGLVFSLASDELNTDDKKQQPVQEITTVSKEEEEKDIVEPVDETSMDEEPDVLDAILECSVPDRIRRGSTPSFSAILFDSNLRSLPDQTIVWTISPGNISFTSITQYDGTTEVTPDLPELTPGIYDVSATLKDQEDIACTDSFSYTRGGGGGGGSSNNSATTTDDDDNDDNDDNDNIAKPELRITTPTAGDVYSGQSSGGIPVFVTGTASDESGIQSVEVRWNAWYGLTGYRMANPNGPDDWSIWDYDLIEFNTEGTKTILVKATDNEGNKSWKAVTFNVTFTIDNTKPLVEITAPGEGSVITGPADGVTVTVNGTTSDIYTGVQNVEVRTDLAGYEQATQTSAGDWSTWSYDVTFTTSGPHQIVARVVDNAGNMQWYIANVTVNLESDT